VFPRPILFINDQKIRFRAAIHNYIHDEIQPDISRLVPELRLEHRQSKKRLQYRKRQRFEMNLKGLTDLVEREPNSERAKFYLAATKSEFMHFNEVIADYYAVLQFTKDKDQESQVRILLGCILCQVAEVEGNALLYEQAKQVIAPLLDGTGVRAESYFIMSWAFYGLGYFEEAIQWAEMILNDIDQVPLTNFYVIPDMYFVYPLDVICQAKKALGDLDGAVKAAEQLLKWKPKCRSAKRNLEDLLQKVSA